RSRSAGRGCGTSSACQLFCPMPEASPAPPPGKEPTVAHQAAASGCAGGPGKRSLPRWNWCGRGQGIGPMTDETAPPKLPAAEPFFMPDWSRIERLIAAGKLAKRYGAMLETDFPAARALLVELLGSIHESAHV